MYRYGHLELMKPPFTCDATFRGLYSLGNYVQKLRGQASRPVKVVYTIDLKNADSRSVQQPVEAEVGQEYDMKLVRRKFT